ncbi:MAG TPA: hypothetical protein VH280_06045 [Verrucomicrobiae bacterium]|jgi:uncharacterized membrane protein YjjP (DUF1212 family)|nr:hypothetical protein [Verrucomicrobiae bacterium]
MNTDASAKIAMLKGSMRCLAFGLLGLLPFVGLPFAILALWTGGRVRRYEVKYWNAAKPFRIWGVVCAGAGAVVWATIGGLIVFNALMDGWPYND